MLVDKQLELFSSEAYVRNAGVQAHKDRRELRSARHQLGHEFVGQSCQGENFVDIVGPSPIRVDQYILVVKL